MKVTVIKRYRDVDDWKHKEVGQVLEYPEERARHLIGKGVAEAAEEPEQEDE